LRLGKTYGPERLGIPEDRHGRRSTLVASQLPISTWHEMIGVKTLADAVLDRLAHNAYKIALKGESIRKTAKSLTQSGH
jgi:DNA replication protein DnaC